MDWFRSHHGAPFDTKLAVIAKRTGKTRGMVAAIWWAVLDHASQNETRGNTETLVTEEIAVAFDFDESDVAVILEAMRERGMILKNGMLAAWGKRQTKREDTSTERVKRWRETQRNTLQHGNAPRLDKRRESSPPKPPPKNGANGYMPPLGSIPWTAEGPDGSHPDGAHLAWSFHRLREIHFHLDPPSYLRPDDISVCQGWVDRGHSYDNCRDAMDDRMKRMAEQGQRPPGSVKFFGDGP